MFHLDSLKYMHRSDKEHINILQNKFKKRLGETKTNQHEKTWSSQAVITTKKKIYKTDFFFLVAQFGPVQKL